MTDRFTFTVLNARLVVRDTNTGTVSWEGRPLGRDVLEAVELPRGRGAAVLVDSWEMPRELGSNLVAIDGVGKLLWQAPLPTKEADDHYVPSLRMMDQGVSATSWSAYWVILNPKNGKIRHKEFAK